MLLQRVQLLVLMQRVQALLLRRRVQPLLLRRRVQPLLQRVLLLVLSPRRPPRPPRRPSSWPVSRPGHVHSEFDPILFHRAHDQISELF